MESFGAYLTTAFALVFVIEGLLYALFPEQIRRILAMAIQMPASTLRKFGATMVALGFILVYLIELFRL